MRPLVAILPGPSLPPVFAPARSSTKVALFESLAALIARAAIEPAACGVADGAALGPRGAHCLRAACPDATLCVVGSGARNQEDWFTVADAVLFPDEDLDDRLTALVRFALGEPMRGGPRLRASGRVRVDSGPALVILDVSEGGVRAGPAPDDIIGEVELVIELDEGPTVMARGREIRRHDGSVVLALNALVSRDRTAMRRWMLGHTSARARVSHPPRRHARR